MGKSFNPITYANKLKEAGLSAKVADAQAEEMVNMMNLHIATQENLIQMEFRLKTELKEFIIRAWLVGFSSLATIQGVVMYFMNIRHI
jgi:hypothetical protein